MRQWLTVWGLLFLLLLPGRGEASVSLVAVQGEIDGVQAARLSRALEEAEAAGHAALLLELDTFGGQVDAAVRMRDRILQAKVPVLCYVQPRAWSAGALLALACERIYMAPGSSIGAAEPVPATEKNIAALKAEFSATASRRQRDVRTAEAMVDKTMGYGAYAAPGQILALTDQQALAVHLADGIADSRNEVLRLSGLGAQELQEHPLRWSDEAAAFLAQPLVKSLLLAVVVLALLTELKTAGVGVAGLVGLAAALLFFGEPWLSGGGPGLEALLFAVGLVFAVIEIFIPGFGFFGLAGGLAMVTGVFLALGGGAAAVQWMALSVVLAIGAFVLLARRMPDSALWHRLELRDAETDAAGYAAQTVRRELLGCAGEAVTPLRPSGTIRLGLELVDAVSESEFIPAGVRVEVVGLRGGTVVVRRKENGKSKEEDGQ